MLRQVTPMVFHYTAGHGKQGTLTLVPSMSLTNPTYIAVAEVDGCTMEVSNPRPLDEALVWARQYCGSFCLLP
jgi:hypothetical protein